MELCSIAPGQRQKSQQKTHNDAEFGSISRTGSNVVLFYPARTPPMKIGKFTKAL
jgi:hypothetical protein